MKRRHAYFFVASLPLALWAAQGCSSSLDTPGVDDGGSGSDTDGGGGGQNADGGGGGTTDGAGGGNKEGGGGNGEGGVMATTPGTQLSNVTDAQIIGATTDGLIVYLNFANGGDANAGPSLEAVPIAGGTAKVISPGVGQADDFAISGKVVVYYTNVDQMTGIAASISTWSAATGKLNQVATNGFDGLFDASEDGTYVAFSSAVTATTMTLSVRLTDASKAAVNFTTAAHTDNQNPGCGGFAFFKKAIAVAQWCTTKTATTGPLATIDTGVAAPATSSISTTATPTFVNVNDNATNIFWSKAGTGDVSNVDGTNSNTFEAKTIQGMLNTDGSRAIYITKPAAGPQLLKVAPTSNQTAFQLASGIQGILGPSHDYTTLAVNRTAGDSTDGGVNFIDISIANAADAGNPTPVTDAGVPIGYATANAYFFYLTDLDPATSFPAGTLKAHPVASGADKTIAMSALFPTLVDTTTKAVWLQNVQQVGMSAVVDIASADAAGAGAPTVVVQGADPSYAVSGTKIAYFSPGKGIYAVAVP
jgi:hypothetical protein